MKKQAQQLIRFLRFYLEAETKFQVHSPFVFELVNVLLEDRRWYYAFRDIEAIRGKMLRSPLALEINEFGTGTPQKRRVRVSELARTAASSPYQGRLLFRLAQWLKPERILELGTSVGIGTLYLAAAARQAMLCSLDGSPDCTHVAKTNLKLLKLDKHAHLKTGPFLETLPTALNDLEQVDLVFFDGNHKAEPTLSYFNLCLPYTHPNTVLVFDDIYWSAEMHTAWQQIQTHKSVTLTVDCFELAFVFLNPDFKTKQHFKLLPSRWKPWKR